MIKTLNELDRAMNKQQVTFGDKQTFETYEDVYHFGETHKLLDISTNLKTTGNGRKVLSELYTKDDKVYELETLYSSTDVFLYAVATEIIETK